MKKKANKKIQIAERKSIQNKIEVLKIDYSFISHPNGSDTLKAVKDEINNYCQRNMPSDLITKSAISNLLGVLVYSKHPDKVGDIFMGIEKILTINTNKEIVTTKKMKKKSTVNYPLIILGVCIVLAALIFAYLFRYETIGDGLLLFDRWTGEHLFKDYK